MKMKSAALLTLSFVAGSFLYISPAIAEEMDLMDQPISPLADAGQANNPSNMTDSLNQNPTSANPTDEASPDTATGDDDY